MSSRLILAIISTILEETGIVVVVLWILPALDIRVPIWGLVLLVLAWGAFSAFTYLLGTRALMLKQVDGMTDMVGCKGVVITPLAPSGSVRIRGEVWTAKSEGGLILPGVEVVVVQQKKLKLVVREHHDNDSQGAGKAPG